MQEVALDLGYSGAALPLWEEFLVRFLSYQTQLQHVLPLSDISHHLARLGQLYEAQSPALGEICTLIAPLSAETIPGSHLISSRTQIVFGLKQRHTKGPEGASCTRRIRPNLGEICTLTSPSVARQSQIPTVNGPGDISAIFPLPEAEACQWSMWEKGQIQLFALASWRFSTVLL